MYRWFYLVLAGFCLYVSRKTSTTQGLRDVAVSVVFNFVQLTATAGRMAGPHGQADGRADRGICRMAAPSEKGYITCLTLYITLHFTQHIKGMSD